MKKVDTRLKELISQPNQVEFKTKTLSDILTPNLYGDSCIELLLNEG